DFHRVQTPSHVESTIDEDDDEEVQGVNIEGEDIDEEANSEESEGNELYRDLNVNLEGPYCDKLILDTYGDTVSFKRRRDDEDKDEEPSAGSNWGSKRRRAGKEPESTSTPKEKTPKSTGKSTEGSKSLNKFVGESAHAEEPMHTAKDLEEPAHQEFKTRATVDQPVDETPQPSDWFQNPLDFPSPIRDWNKTLPTDHGPVQPWEFARDVYSKRRIIAVTKLQIVEWHGYKHLDWITVRRDDDKLYTFKEGDFIMPSL
ncbi:hypothetical protein Tco_0740319, partial [Tanacetum coccineum]